MRPSTLVIAALAATVALGGCAQTRRILTRADLVREAPACADTSFVIYFNEGSDRITRQAGQLIRATASRYKACRVTATRVVGLADATGSPVDNLTLSQRRARAVAAALAKAGLPPATFEVAAGGELGAVTRDGLDEPVRRRAEVFLSIR
jgi:outer membrane protein OmpA-like peptidoglycan-associated protein